MIRASRPLSAPSAEAETAAQEALSEAFDRFPVPVKPILIWKRYPVTAGMAYYKINTIGLSRIIPMTSSQIRETVLHEYAHLLAVARHGQAAANHGRHWKKAMLDFGLPPKVRHDYSVERPKPRWVWAYRCQKCGTVISRARRLPRTRRWAHAGCGGPIVLFGRNEFPTAHQE